MSYQRPVAYVQQRSGCGQIVFWLLVLFVVVPAVCCLGQTVIGLLAAETSSP